MAGVTKAHDARAMFARFLDCEIHCRGCGDLADGVIAFDHRRDLAFAFDVNTLAQVDGSILCPRQVRWDAGYAMTGIAAKIRSHQELGNER
jgi:hypothetical protein